MPSNLRMGLRLVVRTRLLIVWLAGMALAANLSHAARYLAPDLRVAHWILAASTLPVFFSSLFAREYLAQPLSFFVAGTRRRLLRAQLGLCLFAGLGTVLGMRLVASESWAGAWSFGALGLAAGALICVVTLLFARWGVAAWLFLVQWPLLGAHWLAGSWPREQALISLIAGTALLALLGIRLRNAGWHRALCGRPVAQLADWWDPGRLERMKARQESARPGASRRSWSRVLAGTLDRAQAAVARGDHLAARAWQLAWVVVSRSLPQTRRLWSPAMMVVFCVAILPYLDSLTDRRETALPGWFAGWLVAPALYLAGGMVRLGRRNGVLASRAGRERAGLLVGAGALVATGILGAAFWAAGRALAPVMPALSLGGWMWVYHAPALHVAFLAAAIAPAQLLAAVALRRPGIRWPGGLGFQLLLVLHVLQLVVRTSISGPIVAGFSLASAAAFAMVWSRRCRRGDLVE